MKKYKFLFLFAMASLIGIPSCTDYLNINDDPNNPVDAEINNLMPFSEATVFGSLGMGKSGISELVSVYAQHTVQRGDHDDYKITENEFSLTQCWEKLYAVVLPDLDVTIKKATETNSWSYVGMSKLLKVQLFSSIVDIWGDMPYFEAGKGAEATFPKYDDDKLIYKDLFRLGVEALADLDKTSTRNPGADDLIYKGDMNKWKKYGRSLLLNMYNKVRLTDLYDPAKVSDLIKSNLISGTSEDFELVYNTSITPENRNPGFIREYTEGNPSFFISPYFYLIMKGDTAAQNTMMLGIRDPRIPYYFYNQLAPNEQAENPISYLDGRFLSIWFASYDKDPNEGFDQGKSQTLVGLWPVGGAYDNGSGVNGDLNSGLKGAGAQRILTTADLHFIRAELALTKNTGESAKTLLESGIKASMAKINAVARLVGAPVIADADITTYINKVLALYDKGDDNKKLEVIITQKWIHEFGNGLEAYNDIRRTGYPLVCDPSKDPNPYSEQTRPYPVTLPYDGDDLQTNPNAKQHNQYTDKVFWDA
ncbi:MAG: SusD/RagB family nutrient-binding outer membrane lipoprotein, partial [Saprospiraceae bacterium]